MNYAPTPEEFLSQIGIDEDDDFAAPIGDPLESIAHSLHLLTDVLLRRDAAEQAETDQQERYDSLDQAYLDLEEKHQALYGLLADVEKIVAPSTSKLANSVREAITRWRNPEPVEPPEQGESPEPGAETAEPQVVSTSIGPSPQPESTPLRCRNCATGANNDHAAYALHAKGIAWACADCGTAGRDTEGLPYIRQPAHDADVEEWALYAEARGFEVASSMNRSQIRTMLGIPQPVEA